MQKIIYDNTFYEPLGLDKIESETTMNLIMCRKQPKDWYRVRFDMRYKVNKDYFKLISRIPDAKN